MAVAKVQSTKTDPAIASSVLLTLTGAPVAGNVLQAAINFSEFGVSRTITTPAGWTKLIDDTQSFVRHAVFWRLVQSGDGAAWTFTISDGTQPISGELAEFSGADTGVPTQFGTTKSSSTGSLAGPSITPVVLGTLPVPCFTEDTNQVASTTVSAGFTIQETAGGVLGRGGLLATRNSTTSDTTTAIQATWTLTGGADSCIASMVLISPPVIAPDLNALIGEPIAGYSAVN